MEKFATYVTIMDCVIKQIHENDCFCLIAEVK